jgi:hypothetical protein
MAEEDRGRANEAVRRAPAQSFFDISFPIIRTPDRVRLSATRLSGGTIVVSEMGSASPGFGRDGGPRSKTKKAPGGSAQVSEKAQFRQENPRKSKPFSLMGFGRALVDFAGFGEIWIRLGIRLQAAAPTPPAALPNAADCRQGRPRPPAKS